MLTAMSDDDDNDDDDGDEDDDVSSVSRIHVVEGIIPQS